jgi:hypothetical protein
VNFDAEELAWRPKIGDHVLSESLVLPSIAALIAPFGYYIVRSLTYKCIRIPSAGRLSLGSAWDCVHSTESKKVLISLCQSSGTCLTP